MEIKPGHALVVNKDGSYQKKKFMACFGRKSPAALSEFIFSRGTRSRYLQERKILERH